MNKIPMPTRALQKLDNLNDFNRRYLILQFHNIIMEWFLKNPSDSFPLDKLPSIARVIALQAITRMRNNGACVRVKYKGKRM